MAEYTDEQIAEIKAAARAEAEQDLSAKFAEDEARLKAHAEKVLAEKKTLEEKSKAKMLELEQKAIDEAKAKGELEKAYELEKAQTERKISELAQAKEGIFAELSAMKEQKLNDANLIAVKDITSQFAKQDPAMELLAKSLVTHSFSEDGSISASFKNLSGEVVADSFKGWLEVAQKDPVMQQYLAGSKAQGFDSSNLKPTKTNKEHYKNDVQGFLNNAFNS